LPILTPQAKYLRLRRALVIHVLSALLILKVKPNYKLTKANKAIRTVFKLLLGQFRVAIL
jgi:hypothetical protein